MWSAMLSLKIQDTCQVIHNGYRAIFISMSIIPSEGPTLIVTIRSMLLIHCPAHLKRKPPCPWRGKRVLARFVVSEEQTGSRDRKEVSQK